MHPHRRPTRSTDARSGVALMLTLVALTMAFILVMGFLAAQSTSVGLARNVDREAVARGIAETGLNAAILDVQNDNNWRTDQTNGIWINAQPFNGGTVTVWGQDGVYNATTNTVVGSGSLTTSPTDPLTLTSIGTYGGVSYTIRALINSSAYNTTSILFVVPNPASLSTDDLARQTYFTGLNWNVTLIADSSTQAQFNSAIASANLVYISANASSTNIGTSLKTASVGVVTEQPGMAVGLGLTSTSATNTYSGAATQIASTGNYITQNDTVGSLTICSSNQALSYYSGTLAGGAVALARKPSTTYGSLVVIDVGGALIDGTQALGRRVFLPWGGSGFVFSSLNSSGTTMLQSVLNWAAGAGGTSSLGSPGLVTSSTLYIKGSSTVDSFNSAQGAYGGSNIGSSAVIASNAVSSDAIKILNGTTLDGSVFCGEGGAPSSVIELGASATLTGVASALSSPVPIPSDAAPSGMPASAGNVTYNGSTTTTLSTNQHYGKLTISGSAIVQVSGNISIQCDAAFAMSGSSQLVILANSSLKLYCGTTCALSGSAQANMTTGNPTKLLVFMLSTGKASVAGTAQMYGTVLSPTGLFALSSSGQFYGTYFGKTFSSAGSSKFHQDTNGNGASALTSGGAVNTSTAYAQTVWWTEQPP